MMRKFLPFFALACLFNAPLDRPSDGLKLGGFACFWIGLLIGATRLNHLRSCCSVVRKLAFREDRRGSFSRGNGVR